MSYYLYLPSTPLAMDRYYYTRYTLLMLLTMVLSYYSMSIYRYLVLGTMLLISTPHHLSYTTLHMYTCHVRDSIILVYHLVLLLALYTTMVSSSTAPLGTSTIHYYVVLRTREHTITIYTLLLLMGRP